MEDTAIPEKGITDRSRHLILACLIGLAAGCYAALAIGLQRHGYVSDFQFFWDSARILLSGGNPYHGFPTTVPDPLYYPLPTVLAAVPLAYLPVWAAGGVAVGVSAAVLAAVTPRWRWGLFASSSFLMAASLGQWSPLIVVGALVPAAGYLAALKPNLGLAGFAYRPTWLGVGLGLLAGLISLAFLPSWPWDWLANLKTLEGHPPPLFTLGGCWIGLAVLRWRQPEARLLLAMAAVPQLLFFADQLPLWLVARTRRETILLSLCSLAGYAGFVLFLNSSMPYVPQAAPWVLGLVYGPALAVVLARRHAARASAEDLRLANTSVYAW
ncbi:MAG TPA: hypothetical protein VFL95_08045 [Gemmatimonadales bacterium]|nr:hypothetical protein [Gemmatimonadales bacterium]